MLLQVANFYESMTIVASRAGSVLWSVARKQAVPMVRPVGDVRFRPRQGCLRGLLLLPAPLLLDLTVLAALSLPF